MMKLLGLIGQRLRNEFGKEYDNVIKYKPTQNTNLEEPRKMEGIKVYQSNSLTYKIGSTFEKLKGFRSYNSIKQPIHTKKKSLKMKLNLGINVIF